MILLDGKKTAEQRNLVLKKYINTYEEKGFRKPSLAIILIGNNPASESYVKGKGKACELVGIEHQLFRLEDKVTQSEVSDLIEKLNVDPLVDGMILQLPIPKHLDDTQLIDLISKDKDADGFHVMNQGNLYQKRKTIQPATPKGIMSLLAAYDIDVLGMHAVIVGRSNIVGFPVARLLMDKGATITVCHTKTKDIGQHTKQADLIVAAAGRPLMITRDMVKEGAVIVDVGVNRVDNKLVGDVDFDGIKALVSYMTPVPKGVGPMTINALLENTFELYVKHIQS